MSELNCALCNRIIPAKHLSEKHHLTPVSKGGRHKDKVLVRIDCGNQVHALFTNRELKEQYNTLEVLKAEPRVRKWIQWVRKQKFGVCHKSKKRRRG